MSDTRQHEPVRSCIGCRRRRPSSALVRVTAATGIVADGPSHGRGAWLCRSDNGIDGARTGPLVAGDCLDAALARRAFERAWRRPVRADEIDALRRLGADDGSGRAC